MEENDGSSGQAIEEVWKRVFVTVGTTTFEKLVDAVCSAPLLEVLAAKGCQKVVIQAGRRSNLLNGRANSTCPAVEIYSYKDSIADDIEEADLIIGHAGAGTTLDVLRRNKLLVVVINKDLMDDHQSELADKLSEECHLYKCIPETLAETLKRIDKSHLKPLPRANPKAFEDFLDQALSRKSL